MRKPTNTKPFHPLLSIIFLPEETSLNSAISLRITKCRETSMPGAMRIPRIKFPRRLPKPSSTGSASQPAESTASESDTLKFSSDVPRPPSNTAIGGNASLQPKRTPVSDQEIEAIMLGGCI